MDYPYERLSPQKFQKLCQALISDEYSGTQCYPVNQPDGGRDVGVPLGEEESAHIIYQVKFTAKIENIEDPHGWFRSEIKDELEKARELEGDYAKKYIVITNVKGTAPRESGSIDQVQDLLDDALDIPTQVWWRDDIDRRLDNRWTLKWSYPELMTGPDLIRLLVERGFDENHSSRETALKAYLSDQYGRDKEVKFKQVDLRSNVFELFIDVPVDLSKIQDPDEQGDAVDFLYERISKTEAKERRSAEPGRRYYRTGARGQRLVGAASFLLDKGAQEQYSRIVLHGAPGQGKSTVGQYICQIHRAKLLGRNGASDKVPNHHWSAATRLPFKVDLRDLGAWLAGENPFSGELERTGKRRTLEGYLAAHIEVYSGGAEFSVSDLQRIISDARVLLMLDGLDEVADTDLRRRVVEEIQDGERRIRSTAQSTQCVVTSRPAAYTDAPLVPRDTYAYCELAAVPRGLAIEYVKKWCLARDVDQDEASEIGTTLREKLNEMHIRELAKNPMQLAILLLLIYTRGRSLPDKRTALYDKYIDLFMAREAEKSEVVRNNREILIHIHRLLGWNLHSEAETGENSGRIGQERLKTLIADFLEREGFDAEARRVERLFSGVVERVVALVMRVEGTFEFEVQPLQEYFAARYLYEEAPYAPSGRERTGTKPERFRALLRSSYWLNVTRFFAGCFSRGELAVLVEELYIFAEESMYRYTDYPGYVSATLLSDWVFTARPKSVNKLMDLLLERVGLRALLSSFSLGTGRGSALRLPERCGRDRIVEEASNSLIGADRRDARNQYAEFLSSMCSWSRKLELVERLKAERDIDDEDVLMVMDWLGMRDKVSVAMLNEVLNTEDIHCRSIRRLVFGGYWNFLTGDRERAQRAVDVLLDRNVAFAGRGPGTSPLAQLAEAINITNYAKILRHKDREVKAASVRRGPTINRDQDEREAEGGSGEVAMEYMERCQKFVSRTGALLERPVGEWQDTLGVWDELVSTGVDLWGDRLCWAALANIAAVAGETEHVSEPGGLFDENVSLVERMKYASDQGANKTWWKEICERASSTYEKQLFILALASWAEPSTVADIKDEVQRTLGGLSRREYSAAVIQLSNSMEGIGILPQKDFSGVTWDDLEYRLALLIYKVGDEETKNRVYNDSFRKISYTEDLPLLWTPQDHAFMMLRAGKGEYKEHLSVLSDTYQAGAEVWRRHGPFDSLDTESPLPDVVIREVLDNKCDYPPHCIGLCQASRRLEMAEKGKAVGKIAKDEGWFI